jgi:WD40 repeat protein
MQAHLKPVRAAAFGVAQSATRLATAGDDNAVLVWDAETEHRHPASVGPQGGQLAIAGDSPEPVLAVGSPYASIGLVDPRTGAEHRSLHCNPSSGRPGHRCSYGDDTWSGEHVTSSVAAATIRGRSVVASCGGGTQAVLWDPATADVIRELHTRTSVLAFGYIDNRTVIAMNGNDRSPTSVWDPDTGEHITDLGDAARDFSYGDVAWALDFGTAAGRTVLVTAALRGVNVWDPLTGALLARLPGPESDGRMPGRSRWATEPRRGLAAGPDLLAFADKARVRVWDTVRDAPLSTVDDLDGLVTCLSLIPTDGRCLLVIGTTAGTVSLWDAGTAARLSTLATFARPVTGVATATLDGQPHVFAQSDSRRLTACRLSPSLF